MKFDICLMNPPYTGSSRNDYNIHLKFLNKICEYSHQVISIQPINFIYKSYHRKSPEKSEKQAIYIIENYKTNIYKEEILKFNGVFSRILIGIIDIKINIKEQGFYIDNNYFNKVDDVYLFSGNKYIEQFYEKVKTFYEHDNLNNYCVYIDKREDGNKDMRRINDGKLKTPFVGLIKYSSDDNIIKNGGIKYGERDFYYINFPDEQQAENFINYTRTNFFITCLNLFNYNCCIPPLMNYIPWLDFSKSYTDKELFEMIGMKRRKILIKRNEI